MDKIDQLKEKARLAPPLPGVYKFLSPEGRVLYVGKAKNLRKRLGQYFGQDNRRQIPILLEASSEIDYIVTSSEIEGLFLENTIIKEHYPPYNILLKDDKQFAFIYIDYNFEIPHIGYSRKVNSRPKVKFFGPYSSVKKIMLTLDAVRKIFTYCDKTEVSDKPCFYYHLHRCPGVCAGKISVEDYKTHLLGVVKFLQGHTRDVAENLEIQMSKAASELWFEKAANLRDKISALAVLRQRQLAVLTTPSDLDVIALHAGSPHNVVMVLQVREGYLKDKQEFVLFPDGAPEKEILQTFLERYYFDFTGNSLDEVLVPLELPNSPLLEELLRGKIGRKVPVHIPERGEKHGLLLLAQKNAAESFKKLMMNASGTKDAENHAALKLLQELLLLPSLPKRMECFDMSNTQGTNPVGSMTVFVDGAPARAEYRKFKVRVKDTPDDFAMMRETLTRRFLRSLEKKDEKDKLWPFPDLLVIDGGKGQLGVAVEVLEELGLTDKVPVIGLAKRIEEIFKPHNPVPLVLPHSHVALQMLQRIRDEAHRFGITFHRSLRSKQAVKSELDEIKGVGPVAKKLLKKKFGTLSAIRGASLEELTALLGQVKAKKVVEGLGGSE